MLRSTIETRIGDELLLHGTDDCQFITCGPTVIGQCSQIPAAIIEELKVGGTLCVEVVGVGTITNTIEVAPK